MEEAALAALLAEAGLVFVGVVDVSAPLIPPTLASFASSCSAEDGVSGVTVESDDPFLLDKANSGWYRLARDGGLFGGRGSGFLLAVNCAEGDSPRIWWWVRVELSRQWDIIGAGAASGLLGNGSCHPAFVMLSLDGNVIVRGDTAEASVDSIVVRDPHRIQMFRQHGEWLAERPRTDEFTRAAIERWLRFLSE